MSRGPGRGSGGERAAVDFLMAVARYLAGARLYAAGHNVLQEALDDVEAEARDLLERDAGPSFSFLRGKVVWNDVALRELDDWPWIPRLGRAGVQRLELTSSVTREELDGFLRLVARRLKSGATPAEREADAGDDEAPRFPHLRFGALGLRGQEADGDAAGSGAAGGTVDLSEEARTVEWIHQVAEKEKRVPVAETVATVQSLSVGMHGAQKLIVPFLKLKETDQYTASHCINVSILSMSLAEELGMPAPVVRGIGSSALLHDVGKMEVPSEILHKPDRLTDEERAIIERHPVDGCRMLMASGAELALAATVAYEHHMGRLEGGYPPRRYQRTPLDASRVVQVCDFYDALRTRRSYRAPLPAVRVTEILRDQKETYLDPDYLEAFLSLIERWDPAEVLYEEVEDGDAEAAAAGDRAAEAEAAAAAEARAAEDRAAEDRAAEDRAAEDRAEARDRERAEERKEREEGEDVAGADLSGFN